MHCSRDEMVNFGPICETVAVTAHVGLHHLHSTTSNSLCQVKSAIAAGGGKPLRTSIAAPQSKVFFIKSDVL